MAVITPHEYDTLKIKQIAFSCWLDERGQRPYRDDEVPAHLRDFGNQQRSDIEIYEWHRDKPAKYFAYYRFDQVEAQGFSLAPGAVNRPFVDLPCGLITNFMGVELGRFTLGTKWHDNFGGRRFSFRMEGTNGCTYSGFGVLDSGTYVRMRRVKGS